MSAVLAIHGVGRVHRDGDREVHVYGTPDEPTALRLVVPWPSVLAVAVAVPVLAALVAGVCTANRLPVE